MRQDSRRQLDRAIWRHRLEPYWEARWVVLVGLLTASLFVIGLSVFSQRAVNAEELTLIGQTGVNDDTGSYLLWVFERANGEEIVTRPPPWAAFEAGATCCADVRERGLVFAPSVVGRTLRRCALGNGDEKQMPGGRAW